MPRLVAIIICLLLLGCESRTPVVPAEQQPELYIPSTLGKKDAYQNVELYELKKHWLWPNSFSKLLVPVTAPGRLKSLFTSEQELYRKSGESYSLVRVLTVRMEEYRKEEIRQQNIQQDTQTFFMICAAIGVLMIIGALVARYFKLIFWDELLVSGIIIASVCFAAAWWVHLLQRIALFVVLGLFISAGYSIWRKQQQEKRKQAELSQKDEEANEIYLDMATVTEHLKAEARPAWEKVKELLPHSDRTSAVVARMKPIAKDIVKKARIEKYPEEKVCSDSPSTAVTSHPSDTTKTA